MRLRSLALTAVGLLACSAASFGEQTCSNYQASGTYLTNLSGWATVATTPLLVTAPVVAQGVVKLEDSGALSASAPLMTVVAGTAAPETLTASRITVNADCSVTFRVTCASGCTWEGSGVFLRNSREMHLIITKAVGYPLTASIVLKQISN